jgi:hypothetical protein
MRYRRRFRLQSAFFPLENIQKLTDFYKTVENGTVWYRWQNAQPPHTTGLTASGTEIVSKNKGDDYSQSRRGAFVALSTSSLCALCDLCG